MADAYVNGAIKPKLTDDERRAIHKEALERMEEAWEAERENIREGRDCQRFYAGGMNQWDPAAVAARKDRPILTTNLLPKFVRQMTGDLRKNPPAIKYVPDQGDASEETAEAYNGITRHIEQKSSAKDCYIVATENAAQASQGAFRIVTEYSSRKSFDLEIRIKPVRDPFGVLIDPFAQQLDKSDMRYGFVIQYLSMAQFRAKYQNAIADDIPLNTRTEGFAWRRNNDVCIAEYWVRKPVVTKLYELLDGTVTDDLEAVPGSAARIKRSRDVESYEVCNYIMSGAELLSDANEFPCSYIPICLVVGEEITAEDRTIRKGMVHDARDPQRVCNYARSVTAEAMALQPRSPWLAAVTHIAGHEETWATANTEPHSFLPYNIDPNYPQAKPERSAPPIASSGLDSLYAQSEMSLEGVIGIYRAALGAPSNETSGIAIARKQQEGDTTTFLYPDNLARALGYAGRILAEMIPRVYDQERRVRILKEDGRADMITVNASNPEINDKTGEPLPAYDLDDGVYEPNVTVGPTFASRQAEAAANMIELAGRVPMVGQAAPDIIAQNMDWPGSKELAARLRKALPPALTEEGPAGPPQPPPGPPPDVIAKVEKDMATAGKTVAETRKIEAETQGTQLENATTALQLQAMGARLDALAAMLQQLPQMLAGGAPMNPGAPVSPTGPGMPAPPPAPDTPPNPIANIPFGLPPERANGEAPPMVEVEGMDGPPAGGDLPMVEVETMDGGPPAS